MTNPAAIDAGRAFRSAVHQIMIKTRIENAWAPLNAKRVQMQLARDFGINKGLRHVQKAMGKVISGEPFNIVKLSQQLDAEI